MEDYSLVVIAASERTVVLSAVRDALITDGFPVSFGIDIAGDATEQQLAGVDWDAALVRWPDPELHEIAYLEAVTADDEAFDRAVLFLRSVAASTGDPAGRLIVLDALQHTRRLYTVSLLPALISDEDHPGWNALDPLLRFLASATDGIIYAQAEGFCDADGELLLEEPYDSADPSE